MDLAERDVITTEAIKGHVVEKEILVHMVFSSTEALQQAVSEKLILNSELAADNVKVASLQEDK